MGAELHLTPVIDIAGKLDLYAPVLGRSGNISGNPLEVDTAIMAFEADLAMHVGQVQSAVVRLESEIGDLRNEDFVTDAPTRVVASFRSRGTDLTARADHGDLSGEEGGVCLGIRRGIDAGPDRDIPTAPALNGDPAVVGSTPAQAPDGGRRLLTDLAVARAVPVVAAIVAAHSFFR